VILVVRGTRKLRGNNIGVQVVIRRMLKLMCFGFELANGAYLCVSFTYFRSCICVKSSIEHEADSYRSIM
jgi:hypothetical protein